MSPEHEGIDYMLSNLHMFGCGLGRFVLRLPYVV